jgi:Tol biopolymer transport system component
MERISVSDIYLAAVAGGEPKRLTYDGLWVRGLAWTPDGREVVFSSSRGGSYGLWRVPASGGAPEQVVGVGRDAHFPSISRRGNRLAYTESFSNTNIWRIQMPGTGVPAPAATSSPTKLIASTRVQDSQQFSPDGKRIAFASDRSGSLEIWVSDSEGLNPVQLTSIGSRTTGTPRWSPDGQWIAFDSRPGGNPDIYVINAQGGSPRRLTTDLAADVVPSWSRDGKWIYFGSNRTGEFQIWKVPSEGGQAIQITRKGGFEAFESPDGKLIYYAKGRYVPGIWKVAREGGEETPVPGLATAGYYRYWAVTERGIYFVPHRITPRPVLQFFSFATQQATQVLALDKPPMWATPGLAISPDEHWILYAQIDRDVADIMLLENFR